MDHADHTEHSHHEHHEHHTHHDHSGHDDHAHHSPDMFREKFWISLALSIPTVLLSSTIQDWLGFELSFAGSSYVPAILGTVIFFYGGMVFLRGARSELAAQQPGMMTLISMAITVALVYSLAVTLRLVSGMDYWWELATLVTIMLLGHWMEMASVANAQGALDELAKLLPDKAEVLRAGKTQLVAVDQLKVGDKVLVRPGTKVPGDGEVVEGESQVDESMLTGESRAVDKLVGSEVIGGTINKDGALTIRIVRVGDKTTLAGIMQLVDEAQKSKSNVQLLADRAAFYLTFIAIGAAIATLVGWWLAGESADFILERVVTVLIIACPHALGLAIPLVAAISTTKAAKSGLLVRQRRALESARNIDVVLFDKTGTLTRGEQGVTEVVADDKQRLLTVAAALEASSEHSIAKAIIDYANQQKVAVRPVSSFTAMAGRGVRAKLAGKTVYAGGPRLLEELDIQLKGKLKKASQQAAADGKTVIYVIEDKSIIGAIMLADVIRDESRQAVEQLHQAGKQVAMLTGDSHGVAAWVAEELGIDQYFAEVLPENKAAIVKQLQQDGRRVAMVGDGVNDAPALVQADVGIAIGAGTDVAIESADIILASNDPRGVNKIVSLSRATYRKMIENLIWAVGYNALALPLAAGVLAGVGILLSPAVGAVLMSISTIVVALNAQLLRSTKV